MVDGVRDGRGDAGKADLTYTPCSQSVEVCGRDSREDVDVWGVCGGDDVVGEAGVDGGTAALVVLRGFEESLPTPMTTAPSIWLRAARGLGMRPASITVTIRLTRRRTISGCQITSAKCAPYECNFSLGLPKVPGLAGAGDGSDLSELEDVSNGQTPVIWLFTRTTPSTSSRSSAFLP